MQVIGRNKNTVTSSHMLSLIFYRHESITFKDEVTLFRLMRMHSLNSARRHFYK